MSVAVRCGAARWCGGTITDGGGAAAAAIAVESPAPSPHRRVRGFGRGGPVTSRGLQPRQLLWRQWMMCDAGTRSLSWRRTRSCTGRGCAAVMARAVGGGAAPRSRSLVRCGAVAGRVAAGDGGTNSWAGVPWRLLQPAVALRARRTCPMRPEVDRHCHVRCCGHLGRQDDAATVGCDAGPTSGRCRRRRCCHGLSCKNRGWRWLARQA